jgi:nucleotidyltransferase substrate binding protein (TIGR01987 family)
VILKTDGILKMETNQNIRWTQRLSNFTKALTQLESAVNLANRRPLSELEKQGMIQYFKYTHELSVNVLSDYLKDQGTQQLYGPKDTIRAAFAVGLIQNGEMWMEMIRDRNHSSHTYDLEIANAIVGRIINSYIHAFKEFQKTCNDLGHGN